MSKSMNPILKQQVTTARSNDDLRIYTLSADKRAAIKRSLTPQQVAAIHAYTLYRVKSVFHSKRYLNDSDWEFYDFNINPDYHNENFMPFNSKRSRSKKLYCECNRELKLQFVVRSVSSGRLVKLGISHFAQHLGISIAVAEEISRGWNKIDTYTDEILIRFSRGERFPNELYDYLIKNHAIDFESTLGIRVQSFHAGPLPIFHSDHQALMRRRTTVANDLFLQELAAKNVPLVAVQSQPAPITPAPTAGVPAPVLAPASDTHNLTTICDCLAPGLLATLRNVQSESTTASTSTSPSVSARDSHEYAKVIPYAQDHYVYIVHAIDANRLVLLPLAARKQLELAEDKLNARLTWLLPHPLIRDLAADFKAEIIKPLNEFALDIVTPANFTALHQQLTDALEITNQYEALVNAETEAAVQPVAPTQNFVESAPIDDDAAAAAPVATPHPAVPAPVAPGVKVEYIKRTPHHLLATYHQFGYRIPLDSTPELRHLLNVVLKNVAALYRLVPATALIKGDKIAVNQVAQCSITVPTVVATDSIDQLLELERILWTRATAIAPAISRAEELREFRMQLTSIYTFCTVHGVALDLTFATLHNPKFASTKDFKIRDAVTKMYSSTSFKRAALARYQPLLEIIINMANYKEDVEGSQIPSKQ